MKNIEMNKKKLYSTLLKMEKYRLKKYELTLNVSSILNRLCLITKEINEDSYIFTECPIRYARNIWAEYYKDEKTIKRLKEKKEEKEFYRKMLNKK